LAALGGTVRRAAAGHDAVVGYGGPAPLG